jgi:hypothetical protein
MRDWLSRILTRLAVACVKDYEDGWTTIGIDFDGVILPHRGEIYDKDGIGQPDETMVKYMHWLKQRGYKITIFTSRCLFPGGYNKVKNYLNKWNLPYDRITSLKIPVVIQWDDGARYYSSDDKHFSIHMWDLETQTERAIEKCMKRREKQFGY